MCTKPFTSSPSMTGILGRYALESGVHVSKPITFKGDRRKFAKRLASSQSIFRLSALSAGGAISRLKRPRRVSLGAGKLCPSSSGQGGTRFSCVQNPFLCVSEGKNFVLEDEDPDWALPVLLASSLASDCEARSEDVES